MQNYNKFRKELKKMQMYIKKEKIYIKAKGGLYLVDFRNGGKKKLDTIPSDAEINYIEEASIENILVVPGKKTGDVVVIVDDLAEWNKLL